jgi:hypothetical protein
MWSQRTLHRLLVRLLALVEAAGGDDVPQRLAKASGGKALRETVRERAEALCHEGPVLERVEDRDRAAVAVEDAEPGERLLLEHVERQIDRLPDARCDLLPEPPAARQHEVHAAPLRDLGLVDELVGGLPPADPLREARRQVDGQQSELRWILAERAAGEAPRRVTRTA